MPEETQTQQGGTDAELSASWDQATTQEQETQETQTQETTTTEKADPSDHSERSELGRKVAALHRRLDGYEAVLSKLDKLDEIEAKLTSYRPVTTETTDDDDVVITKKDLRKTWQELQAEQDKEAKKYSDSYLKQLRNLGRTNLELHSDVLAEMEKNPQFNQRRSNDPAIDAELNYSKAMAAVLSKQRKDVPFKGKDNPQQASVTQSNTTKAKQKIELDPEAREYAEKMGMSEDDIRAAMSKPAPAGMVR